MDLFFVSVFKRIDIHVKSRPFVSKVDSKVVFIVSLFKQMIIGSIPIRIGSIAIRIGSIAVRIGSISIGIASIIIEIELLHIFQFLTILGILTCLVRNIFIVLLLRNLFIQKKRSCMCTASMTACVRRVTKY
uniref:Uncharacterized protein n=1 Tax=Cacopsylla melanoneura TaxID=428564 RepID=A0A8D8WKR1_9HEMI